MALGDSWLFLKRVVLPESKEHPSEDLIMWHLKQRKLRPNMITRWGRMPRPKARTTHGFKGQPVPTNEELLANPPEGVGEDGDVEKAETFFDDNKDYDPIPRWQQLLEQRLADEENAKAREEWYKVNDRSRE